MTPTTINAQNIEILRSSSNAVNSLLTLNKTKLVGRDDAENNKSQSISNNLGDNLKENYELKFNLRKT